eukprot:6893581-Heterocapsa_arctica.AAC.1
MGFAKGNVSFALWWDPRSLYKSEDDFLTARILDFLAWEEALPCTMGTTIQRKFDRMAILLRRCTTTGGTNLEVMKLLHYILKGTRRATAALLDHSTLFQAVEEALQRGNPSFHIACALEEIIRNWEHLTPHMTLRKLQAPGFLWKTQEQAAEAVWLEAARSRDKEEQPLPYHLGIFPAWGTPGALGNSLLDSFSKQQEAPQEFPTPRHLGVCFFNINGEILRMDWIIRANYVADPDPDL